jgi:hypothetical protein
MAPDADAGKSLNPRPDPFAPLTSQLLPVGDGHEVYVEPLKCPGKPVGAICIAPVPGQGRIPLFLPLELKVFRLASQFVKCSLGVVAIGRSLFLPDIELAKY